ncbi:T9SS type A sorting domain-containing protein [Aureispira anguillae]|uniref:T9SS type A sorting domain-containing protein n=1 Tax=Aureispira anguillae TaxID=2864201 RepID=A0A915YJL1_9BACT|nr:T9SS type A sorting domain-containing protein [Aureispira anguillae]BDS14028.1 T9SS type A sorting domain-containing protein [Aureispira anguillae]
MLLINILIAFIAITIIPSQMQAQEWTRQLDGANIPALQWTTSVFDGRDVQQTSDSGYVMTGIQSFATGAPRDYPTLVKVDKDGTTLWTKSYYSDSANVAGFKSLSLVAQPNDDLLLAALNGNTIHLIQTNPLGDTLWTKTYPSYCTQVGGPCIVDQLKLRATKDGNYILIIACHTVLGAPIDWYHTQLIKIDPAGSILWDKTYQDVWAEDGQATFDGGYVLAGHNDNVPMLYKLDVNGDSTWLKTHLGMPISSLHSVVQTPDSAYVASMELNGFIGSTPMIAKIDALGDTMLWTTPNLGSTLGGVIGAGNHVTYDPNGYYVVTGYIHKSHPFLGIMLNNAFIGKVDLAGNVLSEQIFDEFQDNKGMVVRPTNDNGYIMVGDYMNSQGYLVKVDSGLTVLNVTQLGNKAVDLTVFPNPFRDQTTLMVKGANYQRLEVQVFDGLGRQVHQAFSSDGEKVIVPRKHLQAGVYFFTLIGEGAVVASGKLLVE